MAKKRKKILLIDDDASLLMTLRDFLKFEGYDVTTAESAEKGLQELESLSPDLIILDMSMPGMGGIGFLKTVASPEGKPRYPVLVLTARSSMAEFFGGVEVEGFVAKPCDPQDLLMEVGRIIFLTAEDGGRSGEETAAKKRILLGEDSAPQKERLCEALAQAGFDVECAQRGPEVIERAILNHPDLIAMRLMFGHMNGDTVARMLAEMPKTQDIPVVLYDDGNADMSARDFEVAGTNIKELVHAKKPSHLAAAIDKILG